MNHKSAIPIVAWVLLGLLVIAVMGLALGKTDSLTFPSASSYTPSGTHAFAELLREQGFRVEDTQQPVSSIKDKRAVLIGFSLYDPLAPKSEDIRQLQKFASAGGHAAVFAIDPDFLSAAHSAEESVQVMTPSEGAGANLHVNLDQAFFPSVSGIWAPLSLPGGQNGPAELDQTGAGELLIVRDGIIATNRFIGRNDNAAQLVRWLNTVAAPGSRVIFAESTFGNGEQPSLFTVLGPWSYGLWLQTILLCLVIVYTLGRPFGYPDEQRPVQRGARDLVDAVAQLYRRTRKSTPIMRAIYEDADHEVRHKLKLSTDASTFERDKLLPPDLANQLNQIHAWIHVDLKPADTLREVRKLDKMLAGFLGDRTTSLRRRKRYI